MMKSISVICQKARICALLFLARQGFKKSMNKFRLFKGFGYLWFLAFVSSSVLASPVGLWTTIDEKTHKKRAVVQFFQSGNQLVGKLMKVYRLPGDPVRCTKCTGRFKDKQVEGMNFIWGLKKLGDNKWGKGYIVDTSTGKIYRFKMTLKNNKLFVRAYKGISMLGRSQVWVR